MPKVEYSPNALEDLHRIRDSISTVLGQDTAKKILKKILSDIGRLEQYPVSGPDLGMMIGAPTEYRYLFSEKNYVFYRVEFNKVRIIRIVNERQNYIQQLFGSRSENDENE